MKRVLVIIIACLMMVGCDDIGAQQEPETDTKYKVMLNSGSCFVYTFCDEETGVWYISSSKGVTPRLNNDGTLFTEKLR